jgi:rod shape-determining protein MreD
VYYLLYGLFVFIGLILQVWPSSQHLFYGVIPDLLLIIVTFLAINYGKTVGGLTGFGVGFLQDLFSGGLFGINAISKAIVGYLYGILQDKIYKRKLVVPPLAVFVATIANQFLVIFFTDYLLSLLSWKVMFTDVIIPLALCNAALAVIIYPILYKLGGNNK